MSGKLKLHNYKGCSIRCKQLRITAFWGVITPVCNFPFLYHDQSLMVNPCTQGGKNSKKVIKKLFQNTVASNDMFQFPIRHSRRLLVLLTKLPLWLFQPIHCEGDANLHQSTSQLHWGHQVASCVCNSSFSSSDDAQAIFATVQERLLCPPVMPILEHDTSLWKLRSVWKRHISTLSSGKHRLIASLSPMSLSAITTRILLQHSFKFSKASSIHVTELVFSVKSKQTASTSLWPLESSQRMI